MGRTGFQEKSLFHFRDLGLVVDYMNGPKLLYKAPFEIPFSCIIRAELQLQERPRDNNIFLQIGVDPTVVSPAAI